MDEEQWEIWNKMQDWLEDAIVEEKNQKARQEIKEIQDLTNQNKIGLLKNNSWFDYSILKNKGYWRSYKFSDVFSKRNVGEPEINTIFHRSNGHILLGTSKGLFVLQKGYWEWYGVDEIKQELVTDLNELEIKHSSIILSIAENGNGELYLGTLNGLIKIKEGYLGKIEDKITELDGLPSDQISALKLVQNILMVGTSKGLVEISGDEIFENVKFANEQINFIRSKSIDQKEVVAIGSSKSLYLLSADDREINDTNVVLNELVKDAMFDDSGNLYILHNQNLNRVIQTVKTDKKLFQLIPVRDTPKFLTNIYSLSDLPVNDSENSIGMLTDQGISIYYNGHFEHLELPLSDHIAKAKLSGSGISSHSFLSDDQILVFERDKIYLKESNKVYDILSSKNLKRTFIADGGPIKSIDQSDYPDIQTIGGYLDNTTHIAIDKQDRLIVNNGLSILRFTYNFELDRFDREELFYC